MSPRAEYQLAVEKELDSWVPANGGAEEPMRWPDGRTLLFVFNPARRQHGYLNVATDQVVVTAHSKYCPCNDCQNERCSRLIRSIKKEVIFCSWCGGKVKTPFLNRASKVFCSRYHRKVSNRFPEGRSFTDRP